MFKIESVENTSQIAATQELVRGYFLGFFLHLFPAVTKLPRSAVRSRNSQRFPDATFLRRGVSCWPL